VTESPTSRSIVRAIAAMASGLGMTSTAEGVETEEQRTVLLSEGCSEMQGYLFSRPVPAHQIEALLGRSGADQSRGSGPSYRENRRA
jgi:EAL domain-containing protein (putative c-di-GMP-specific phosphodiesterase class I)